MRLTLPQIMAVGNMVAEEFGQWALGFEWHGVTIGRLSLNVLVIYTRHRTKKPTCAVAASAWEAERFLASCNVPPKAAEKFLAKAQQDGSFA